MLLSRTTVDIIQELQKDRFISIHKKYFIREMRIKIYSQFLESYKTVRLQSMALAFGVSVEFIDKYLPSCSHPPKGAERADLHAQTQLQD